MLLDYHSLSSAVAVAADSSVLATATIAGIGAGDAAAIAALSCLATVSTNAGGDAFAAGALNATATATATQEALAQVAASLLATATLTGTQEATAAALAAILATATTASAGGLLVSGVATLACVATLTGTAQSILQALASLLCTANVYRAFPLTLVPAVANAKTYRATATPNRPSVFEIKEGSTLPHLQIQILDLETQEPYDLTNVAYARFVMCEDTEERTRVVNSACGIVSPATDGTLRHSWSPPETAAPGAYLAELRVVWSTGTMVTIPLGFLHVHVNEDLS